MVAHPTFRITVSCNHCENPACLAGCPAKAYTREDGIVKHDPEACIGCRYCIWVCPFDAPQYAPARGKVEKCNLCEHRRARGLEPACAAACPTGALKLAERLPAANDAQSAVPSQGDAAERTRMGSHRLHRPVPADWAAVIPGFPGGYTRPKLRLLNRRRPTERRRDSR